MRRFFSTFFFGGLVSLCVAQSVCGIDNIPFMPGERLEYQLYYNLGFIWVQAGTCEFNVRRVVCDKKPMYQLMAHGRTKKSFDSFFRVRDTLMSFVDTGTLYPVKAYKYAHEDNWHGVDEYSFLSDSNGWKITTRLKRKKKWKEPEESWTSQCGFDVITSIYRLRCLSDERLFAKGGCIEIPVRLEDGEYKLSLTYLGRERIKLYDDGFFSAHAFRLSLVEGNVFKRGDVMKLWLSDEGNRIPLLVESPLRVGCVKALFRGAEKTLNPVSSSAQ